ncbi:hypothetical protein PMAYCL1PPCAC_27492, partial [Pristionchus mayeri]
LTLFVSRTLSSTVTSEWLTCSFLVSRRSEALLHLLARSLSAVTVTGRFRCRLSSGEESRASCSSWCSRRSSLLSSLFRWSSESL